MARARAGPPNCSSLNRLFDEHWHRLHASGQSDPSAVYSQFNSAGLQDQMGAVSPMEVDQSLYCQRNSLAVPAGTQDPLPKGWDALHE